MTEPNSPNTDSAPTSRAVQIGWGMLICATLYVCYFSHLGAIGFVGPDEPRYAWIARAMMESGDWVTPRLYGRPWFEKPPLLYWGAGLCFKWFGVSEAAARFPSALSALLATLALAWLALRLYGAETARWLLLLLPTTVGMIGFSHAAATDMPFSGMLTVAMVCGAVILGLTRSENTPILPRTPWLALVLFGLSIGLAVLAKGPAAIALCGGTVFFWALFTKRWRDAFRLLHPAAIISFCVIALPWYILCGRRNPDFFRIFFIEHNFKRYLTPEFQHIQPFWYYFPIFLLGMFPWFPWLSWYGLPTARKQFQNFHLQGNIFVTAWGIFPLLFFTVSESKLPGYILPSILPFGLLVAIALAQSTKYKHFFARLGLLGVALLYFALILWAWRDLFSPRSAKGPHFAIFIGPAFLLFFFSFAGIGIVVAVLASLANRTRAGQILVLACFLFMVDTAYGSLIKVNLLLSPRTVVHDISPGDIERTYAFKMQRAWLYALNFYLHRDVPEWTPATRGQAIAVTGALNVPELNRNARIVRVISDFSPQAQVIEIDPLTDHPEGGQAQKKE